MIVFKMSTRSQTNHRRLERLLALQSKTLSWWMHSLNISDVSTLHQVSATWNELASANYPYYNSIDIHSSNFANPSLFDDAALLRVVKMSGKYLKIDWNVFGKKAGDSLDNVSKMCSYKKSRK